MLPIRRHSRWLRATLFVALCVTGPLTARAQAPERAPDAALRAAIVRELSAVLRREYVLDTIGAQMATRLDERLAAGAFDQVMSAAAFATRLTEDVRAVYLDRHLAILPPDRYAAFERRVSGDHGAPAHGQADAPAIITRVIRRGGETSVAYLKLPMFDGSKAGLAAIDSAMQRLVGTDALVVDLRGSPGGDADAVRALSSYLFDERTHLVSSIGPRDTTGARAITERWTAPNPLSPFFARLPVYVLIDERTFSAAESFAFGLQRTARATLVGTSTGGGGHMNAPFALPGGFGASISVGRTFDPRTGDGWQSSGVIPGVVVDSEHALDAAMSLIERDAARVPREKNGT